MSELYTNDVDWKATAKDLADRLKAVEDLHQEELCSGDPGCCDPMCGECGELYPCPTIEAARGE